MSLGVVLVSYSANVISLFNYEVSKGSSKCTSENRYAIVVLIVYLFIPFTVLITANAIFIRSLRHRNVAGRAKVHSGKAAAKVIAKREQRRLDNERSYVIILIVASCSFIGLTVAATMTLLVGAYLADLEDKENHYDRGQFVSAVSKFPMILNGSLNFFFYYASDRMFREAFAQMCRKRFPALFTEAAKQ